MKTFRAIFTGTIVWALGIGIFFLSYYVPVLDNPDLQANIALSLAIVLFAMLGARFYYLDENVHNGFALASIMVLTAIALDALITVPFIILHFGGTYTEFFTAASFWIIALEYFSLVVLYWFLKVRSIKN